ncbi:hypothetical protein FD13_GL000105 [Levilactobacillus senmaizukei DSM 21775 = NBRC 103853]|uniref:Uncharacterized protein n=1 Tax=Levilactobacillus senmaizukei DSM 21775 = NBRC 103853 TaxID=1423803 RepID=A0A0R2DSG5_9LACO|nr:hypothetical protein [Levilactobacillus senmaizukei]KRN03322.1 hypothetical protein FD13_GL000105 [Levilactobacillus senmaizukei DSM 21775 = NBRC 103853]
MTEETKWLTEQLDRLAQQQPDFTNRAFWLALERVVAEQDRRTEQLGGEVDGRTWSPDRW